MARLDMVARVSADTLCEKEKPKELKSYQPTEMPSETCCPLACLLKY